MMQCGERNYGLIRLLLREANEPEVIMVIYSVSRRNGCMVNPETKDCSEPDLLGWRPIEER